MLLIWMILLLLLLISLLQVCDMLITRSAREINRDEIYQTILYSFIDAPDYVGYECYITGWGTVFVTSNGRYILTITEMRYFVIKILDLSLQGKLSFPLNINFVK